MPTAEHSVKKDRRPRAVNGGQGKARLVSQRTSRRIMKNSPMIEEEGEEHACADPTYYEEKDEGTLEIGNEMLAVQLNLLDMIENFAEEEPPTGEAIANLIQTEMVAHVAWTEISRKGKGKGRGKGKGKGKGHVATTSVTLRKEKESSRFGRVPSRWTSARGDCRT